MTNNNSNQNENKNTLASLKQLSSIFSEDYMSLFIKETVNAKQMLDNLVKNIDMRIQIFKEEEYRKQRDLEKAKVQEELAAKKEEVSEPVKVIETKNEEVVEQKPVQSTYIANNNNVTRRPSTFVPREGQNARPFERRTNYEAKPNTDNKPFNRPFNNNYQNRGTDFKRPDFANKRPDFNNKPNSVKPFVHASETVIPAKERERVNKKKTTPTHDNEKKSLSVKAQMRMGIIGDNDNEDRPVYRRVKTKKAKEVEQFITVIENAIITTDNLTVKVLSEKIGKPVAEIVKKLFTLGIMATINSPIDFETAELVTSDFGITLEKKLSQTFEEKLQERIKTDTDTDKSKLVKRAPVVVVMGHVDHGKTSLLDTIRKTNVIGGEAGGITQAIGAYQVKIKDEFITFIDTPGHAAFSAMRARGAQITDVAILVVAADDGIMPQTKEAIRHIKQSNVPMIVAINKIDKQNANVDKIKQQLADNDILPEEWGGQTICVPISAKVGTGIDKLLETILLVSEMLELKANPTRKAEGAVIESKLDKGQGPVATILVQNGTLKVGDNIVAGVTFGRIRAMMDENGNQIKKAGPSTPVSVLGFNEVPNAGDTIHVVDEKIIKQLISERKNKIQQQKNLSHTALSVDELFNKDVNLKFLNVIIKTDTNGSLEAVTEILEKANNEEVKVKCVSCGVGLINENDVLMADTSSAIIIAFNSKADNKAKILADNKKIEIKQYKIIYELIDDLTNKAKSMMEPKYKEVIVGHAEVKVVYKITGAGVVAGSMVTDGKVQRNAKARVFRNGEIIGDSYISTLKIRKDDVKEAGVNYECGIKIEDVNNIEVGDIIEAYIKERIND